MPIRKLRLAIYLLFLWFPLFLTYLFLQGGAAVACRSAVQQMLITERAVMIQQTAMLQAQPVDTQILEQRYPNATPEQLKIWQKQVQAQITMTQQRFATAAVIEHSVLECIIEAIIFPLGQISWGSIKYGDGTVTPYSAPIEIHEVWSGYRMNAVDSNALIVQGALALASAVLLLLLLPASFILLPVSRKRAKVRWIHIARVTIYSCAILSVLLCMTAIGVGWLIINPQSPMALTIVQYALTWSWVLIPLWWAAAIRNYLRMPHAAAVAIVLTIMLALLASPCMANILPERWVSLILS